MESLRSEYGQEEDKDNPRDTGNCCSPTIPTPSKDHLSSHFAPSGSGLQSPLGTAKRHHLKANSEEAAEKNKSPEPMLNTWCVLGPGRAEMNGTVPRFSPSKGDRKPAHRASTAGYVEEVLRYGGRMYCLPLPPHPLHSSSITLTSH